MNLEVPASEIFIQMSYGAGIQEVKLSESCGLYIRMDKCTNTTIRDER